GGNGDGAPGGPVGPGGFDERQYGFGGLMDLLRACQKEGLLRVERDRRGGLRVFPGQALQRTDLPQVQTLREPAELQAVTTEPAERMETESEREETERIPVDTTAELLGRASTRPRRPRQQPSRVSASVPRGTRKAAAAARKPAARRAPRASKAPRTDAADEDNE
ncbi:MAG: OST-HTH/LOTUS domain-containing protein, partial [Phycisphaerales bacterium]|nr:OST-HTH/LOTUS domain-containing protein [Phycisphaerales bacterium]